MPETEYSEQNKKLNNKVDAIMNISFFAGPFILLININFYYFYSEENYETYLQR